jgi:DNA-binding Lrp family transcriptional regulator
MSKEFIAPDFLQIPFVVIIDKSLQPLDKTVYGFIYWLEKLKDGRCFASNNYIARALGSSSTSIANSLTRLEKSGHIVRPLNEDGLRSEIKCLVSYKKVTPKVSLVSEGVSLDSERVSSNSEGVSLTDEHNKKINIIKDKEENKINTLSPAKAVDTPTPNKLSKEEMDIIYKFQQLFCPAESIPKLYAMEKRSGSARKLLAAYSPDEIIKVMERAKDLVGKPYQPQVSSWPSLVSKFENIKATLPKEKVAATKVLTNDAELNSFL